MNNPPIRKFGNFEIVVRDDGSPVELGRGAFGVTYLARQAFLEKLAAIKLIKDKRGERERDKFLREARTAARLDHPHIARVLDCGEVEGEGILYYAVEYCEGGGFDEASKRAGGLSTEALGAVAHQIASALGYAHAAGILHRDVKPANILQAGTGALIDAKLIDFGLASSLDETGDGRFLGSPLFASPEQIRGEALDGRSDLYALGMSLWWLALGREPFSGSTSDIIARHLSPERHELVLPSSLPVALFDLIGSLVAKDPSARPLDAAAVCRQLESAGLATEARLADFQEQAAPFEAAPVEADEVAAPIESLFRFEDILDQSGAGSWYEAIEISTGRQRILWLCVEPLDAATEQTLSREVGALMAAGAASPYPAVVSFLRASNALALVLECPLGEPLVTFIRRTGAMPLPQAALFLGVVAEKIDTHRGCPPPHFQPHLVTVHPNGDSLDTYLLPRLLAGIEQGEGITATAPLATMDASASTHLPLVSQFAALLYYVASGRPLPSAALLSPSAYMPIPQLGEAANRTLSLAIAGNNPPGRCGILLEEILALEGAATASVSASRTTASLSHTPAPSFSTPHTASPPPDFGQGAAAAPANSDAQATPPRQAPIPSANATKKRAIPRSALAVAAIGLILVLVALGILLLPDRGGKDAPVKGASDSAAASQPDSADVHASLARQRIEPLLDSPLRIDEAKILLDRYVQSHGRDSFAKDAERRLSKLERKVDVGVVRVSRTTSLAEAVHGATEGQIIEIPPGEHPCGIEVAKSLIIRSTGEGAVTLLQENLSTPAIYVREGANLRIEGIGVKGAAGSTSTALIVASQSTIYFKNCSVAESGGVGILTSGAKARIELENSVVTGSAGNGIELRAGASLQLAQSNILHNAKSGIYANGSGILIRATGRNMISENQECGVQASGGGRLEFDGAEFLNNSKGGMVVSGAGTYLRFSGGTIKASFGTGIRAADGAAAEIIKSLIQLNSEDGVFLEKADVRSLVADCRLEGNARIGIYVDGITGSGYGPRIERNHVEGSAQAGIAFVDASPVVEGNKFIGNGIGILALKGAGGSITSNIIQTGQGQDPIIIEDGATTTESGNTRKALD